MAGQPPFHLRTESDGLDFGTARRLLREGHAWSVEAHSAPRSPEAATAAEDQN
jgi:hypothetical protein